jgi:predicted ATP-binding protein involved in virulence
MYYLNNIQLTNFCGYNNNSFSFSHNGSHNPISVFFGPNGDGKSTVLQAIKLVSNPYQFFGRDNDMFFRKLTYHKDYDPIKDNFKPAKNELLINASYTDIDGNNYSSILDGKGIVESSLDRYNSDQEGWSIYCDADHPMNLNKFQIYSKSKDLFLNLAKAIYGLDVELDKQVESSWIDKETEEIIRFYQDVILIKDKTKVHFRRMSDGEKKITTLIRFLCDEIIFNPSKIVLIDNVEMHIYFKRHPILIDKLVSMFPDKQFIVTTHSKSIIDHIESAFGSHSLYDLENIHR